MRGVAWRPVEALLDDARGEVAGDPMCIPLLGEFRSHEDEAGALLPALLVEPLPGRAPGGGQDECAVGVVVLCEVVEAVGPAFDCLAFDASQGLLVDLGQDVDGDTEVLGDVAQESPWRFVGEEVGVDGEFHLERPRAARCRRSTDSSYALSFGSSAGGVLATSLLASSAPMMRAIASSVARSRSASAAAGSTRVGDRASA